MEELNNNEFERRPSQGHKRLITMGDNSPFKHLNQITPENNQEE